jgi:phage replication initiation protein
MYKDQLKDATSPHIVIRGETISPENNSAPSSTTTAHVDWFACSLHVGDKTSYAHEQIIFITELLRLLAIAEAQIIDTDKGWEGYTYLSKLVSLDGRTNYGFIAHGGESQNDSIHVEINAQGCASITCWEEIAEWGSSRNAVITRLDLAHDDFHGVEITIGVALEWVKNGLFKQNGRPPKARLIDDLESGKGKSLYVGARKNGKLLRIYEKGKQLGDQLSNWVRVELELHNKSRIIPWEALTKPGQYLVGAYPCLAYLSAVQCKVRTIRKAAKITLTAATLHLKNNYGKLVDLLMTVHHEDAEAVISAIRREGVPKKLAAYAPHLKAAAIEEGKP